MAVADSNPMGILGVDFVEYTGPSDFSFENLFKKMGFVETATGNANATRLFQQGKVKFILNKEKNSFADNFAKMHGPAICSMAFLVQDAGSAWRMAQSKGARPYEGKEGKKLVDYPAVYGIGDSLIYFMDEKNKSDIYEKIFNLKFPLSEPKGFGLINIDHFTNNVLKRS